MATLRPVLVSTFFMALLFCGVTASGSGKTLPPTPEVKVPRPPQFVAMAFDGSLELKRWEETRAFAAELAKQKVPLHFTYFISGVYFLNDDNSHLYQGPRHKAGESNIDFGGATGQIVKRIGEVNSAFDEGHEIASHLCGHFDGSDWTAKDWTLDFSLFDKLIFGVLENNGIGGEKSPWRFGPGHFVGFRAPYLSVSDGLWETLRARKYRYDTSDVEMPNYWPDRERGFWEFPLAELRIAGTGKKTLSMDYNFYVAQSGAREMPGQSEVFEKQMYETYVQYFLGNYNGNRAPVHIGHHFPLFNGGAYWRAMMHFARTVCGLPEVRCVNYRELADFMDHVDGKTLAAYRLGEFEHARLRLPVTTTKPLDVKLSMVPTSSGSLGVAVAGGEVAALRAQGMKVHWEVDGRDLSGRAGDVMALDPTRGLGAQISGQGSTLRLNQVSRSVFVSAVATVNGREIARTTRVVGPPRAGGQPFEMSKFDLESQALLGDLPEAHAHDVDQDM